MFIVTNLYDLHDTVVVGYTDDLRKAEEIARRHYYKHCKKDSRVKPQYTIEVWGGEEELITSYTHFTYNPKRGHWGWETECWGRRAA